MKGLADKADTRHVAGTRMRHAATSLQEQGRGAREKHDAVTRLLQVLEQLDAHQTPVEQLDDSAHHTPVGVETVEEARLERTSVLRVLRALQHLAALRSELQALMRVYKTLALHQPEGVQQTLGTHDTISMLARGARARRIAALLPTARHHALGVTVSASTDGSHYALGNEDSPPCVDTERHVEHVVWLQDSFGPVHWRNSLDGNTSYKQRWHFEDAPHHHDSMQENAGCTEEGQEHKYKHTHTGDENMTACPRPPVVGEGEGVQEEAAVHWPWPQDVGYESDGQVHENILASAHGGPDSNPSKWKQQAQEVPSPLFQAAKRPLKFREAGKTVGVATRTGRLGEQKRIAENWIIKSFIMTPLELVATKIQRYWRKRQVRRLYFARMLHQYEKHRQLVRRVGLLHRSDMQQHHHVLQRLVNRVRMFNCAVSKPKMLEYLAARRLQVSLLLSLPPSTLLRIHTHMKT